MEQLFTKAELIKMVAERAKWADEVGAKRRCDSVEFNCKYKGHNYKAMRFTKKQLVAKINQLDALRQEIIGG